MMGEGQLVLQTVACQRGGRTLFKYLSFTLTPGDAALVTGPNGIGKSSLLRLIAGLLEPAAGALTVTGRLALASDAGALDGRKPLATALGFWASLDGGGDVAAALAAMGIEHLADVPVRILSTGQKKRAVLAGVIACGADIWLLDEPTNGLDTASIALLEAAIAQHRAGGGIAVVASHQDLVLPGAQQIVLGTA
jgi:heme exporter protein A